MAHKLLIVGGSSFVGKNLIEQLPKDWLVTATYCSDTRFPAFAKPYKNVRAVQVDLCAVSSSFASLGEFDTLLYLAANSDPKKSIVDPITDAHINTVGVAKVLQSVQFKRVIYFSSGAVYLKKNMPYCISKRAGEEYVQYFAVQKNAQFVIVRLFETYGKYSPNRKIFRRLCEAFENGEKSFEIYGDGKNLVDPMYIDDTVDAIKKMISSKKGNAIVDLCRGKPLSITTVAKIIAKAYGINVKLSYNGVAAERVFYTGNPKPMKKLFGFEATMSLEEGITKWREDPNFNHGKS